MRRPYRSKWSSIWERLAEIVHSVMSHYTSVLLAYTELCSAAVSYPVWTGTTHSNNTQRTNANFIHNSHVFVYWTLTECYTLPSITHCYALYRGNTISWSTNHFSFLGPVVRIYLIKYRRLYLDGFGHMIGINMRTYGMTLFVWQYT